MITQELSAELDLLTQALNSPGTDVAQTVQRLATDARTAVASYLGLSVSITAATQPQFAFTVLDERAGPDDIGTSLLVPLAPAPGAGAPGPASAALILYAATPGAFIDLAADLSWITGRALSEFLLDEHLTLPTGHTEPTPVKVMSAINQALGVLIGRGSSPEQAERDLYARAASAGIEPFAVATLLLDAL